ncbi:MAG TPA: type II toxin-antitoxin system VapC family toxin [Terriglobales bacterium]|nr:type II toxin-antitoxin system VapC family toxin [Terriglobales bacterium]
MTGVVIDASLALAWCFPDEASEYADGVLVALEGRTVMVPPVWALEITNAVLVAERRKRAKLADVRRFVELLGGLTIIEQSQTVIDTVSSVLPLARQYGLSAFDAAYLDVAVRQGAPLATLDSTLERAGRSAGIKIFRV